MSWLLNKTPCRLAAIAFCPACCAALTLWQCWLPYYPTMTRLRPLVLTAWHRLQCPADHHGAASLPRTHRLQTYLKWSSTGARTPCRPPAPCQTADTTLRPFHVQQSSSSTVSAPCQAHQDAARRRRAPGRTGPLPCPLLCWRLSSGQSQCTPAHTAAAASRGATKSSSRKPGRTSVLSGLRNKKFEVVRSPCTRPLSCSRAT